MRRQRRGAAPRATPTRTSPSEIRRSKPLDANRVQRVAGGGDELRLDPVGRAREHHLDTPIRELGGHCQRGYDVAGGSAGGYQRSQRSRASLLTWAGFGLGASSSGSFRPRRAAGRRGGVPDWAMLSRIPAIVMNTTRLEPPELISGSGTPVRGRTPAQRQG